MKANRVYHLIVSREGREPSFLAMRGRTDRIEVVSVEDGEVVLYWNLPPRQASKLLPQRLGAEIVYTRSDDTFLPLETTRHHARALARSLGAPRLCRP